MGSLEIYFKQINSIPLLTAEQEKVLAEKAWKGDKNAIDTLVVSNLRFVAKVANAYKTFLKDDDLKIEDLIMEGNVALMAAARKFDPTKGVRFCTYAVWWIRNAIFRALGKKKMQAPSWSAAGLDLAYGCDEDAEPLVNSIADERCQTPEDLAVNANAARIVGDALNDLKPKERAVLRLRYGFDSAECMTLQQIGESMGHTKEGIRQLEKSGLNKLRKQLAQVA